jgi:hypothetical protein
VSTDMMARTMWFMASWAGWPGVNVRIIIFGDFLGNLCYSNFLAHFRDQTIAERPLGELLGKYFTSESPPGCYGFRYNGSAVVKA